MADKTFASRLVKLRTAAELTQAELAEKSGVSLGAVRDYEQEKRQPSWAAVQALAKALGVKCAAFETPRK
jgi:transcriptional regulator with XRE-family HTH domain